MLVNRHQEIEQFKPEPYWELQTTYRDTTFHSTEGKFLKKEDGEALLGQITGKDLFITAIDQKEGKEYAPKLFDLTSLQVYCNNKFNLTADNTLKTVQRLYELKVVTYPRVDTTFLPNDMYPKISGILKGLGQYHSFTAPLLAKKIRKSPKVFNDKKVTDHHAIIPTGEEKQLGHTEQKVYDIIVRRFLAAFYPDCKVAKTQVTGEIEQTTFLAKGKEILEEGWRALFAKDNKKEKDDGDSKEDEEEGILPTFEKGEHGPHHPTLKEKITKPPKNYTEASLLRAMETAGKQVEDDELRDLMKANGIGRPSTRASIIETLFRRKYIERRKKLVVPTEMGIQLIGTIQNELLKSAELTGQWEKQLKEIEEGAFSAIQFIANMKKMVAELVSEVKQEHNKPRLASPFASDNQKKSTPSASKKKTSKAASKGLSEVTCPKCGQGNIIKGKTAYGCSQWKNGCDLRLPMKVKGKKLTDKQVQRLIEKGATTKLKGFLMDGEKVEGILKLTDSFAINFDLKAQAPTKPTPPQMPPCPKCKKGTIIKGKTAYGCSEWKSGCDFRYAFKSIKEMANGKPLTKELVLSIISQ